ncbi:hypothetical protein [Falsarthrobacter nasiphocae]|uniref:Uncharacterized protein n=1 Tax=Falsarthrobacter nasiphocae TaxID=189863 RepID=A0AAE4C5J0_9MICC|nr:hypothetical protein [Falsarthrobacter nasiphocae]MDR6891563.1 hypothetical protein [Falsarthrobacter nasiphocae]
MRTSLAGLTGLLAVLSAIGASISGWLARHLVGQDGFQQLSGPIASDDAVQSNLAAAATDLATARAVEVFPLLDMFRAKIAEIIRGALDGLFSQDQFLTAAHAVLMSGHASAFSSGHGLSFDMRPLAQLGLDSVTRNFGQTVPLDTPLAVDVPTPSLWGHNLFSLLDAWSGWWAWLLPLALVLGAATVYVARRRGLALSLMGAGLIAGAVVGRAVGDHVPGWLAGTVPGGGLGALLVQKLGEQAVPSIQAEALWLAGAGAVLVLIGVGVGLRAKERRHPYVTA